MDSQLLAAVNLVHGFEASGWTALLVTEEGHQTAGDVQRRSVRAGDARTSGRRQAVSRLPRWARLALADFRALQRRWRMRRLVVPGPLDLVVQYHHRFQDVGRRLASAAGCPLVLRVEAIEVEEQKDWGVRGPRSGRLTLTVGERPLFRAADAIATVSPPLTEALVGMGVLPERVRSLPNGVDTEMFRPGARLPREQLSRHGLEGRFLIGWVGGFRPYHGLDQLAELLPLLEAELPDATVCLLGAGPLQAELQRLQERHPRALALLPPVPQEEVAGWLCAFSVCLQLARPEGARHYSPLKVREYLACGRPTVAPTGTQATELVDGSTGMLYPVGDMPAAVAAISRLHADPDLARALGEAGREVMAKDSTWAALARRIHDLADGVGAR